MQNYKYFLFLAIIFCIVFGFLNFFGIQAKADVYVSRDIAIAQIKYPIPELENCQNKDDCKKYCSVSSHYLACTDFGEKNNLISEEEAVRAKKFIDVLKSRGPGGCNGESACKDYCNKIENQKECFVFSMENGLISKGKLKEMEDGIVMLRSGLKEMSPEIRICIIKKVGAEAVNKVEIGQGEAINLVEIGGAAQICAISFRDALLREASPEARGCVKSIIDAVSGKAESGGVIGQSDITSAILQNCLPEGTEIPSGALPGGGINAEFLQKMQGYYGKSLSPEELESIKKAQEQYQNVIPQGIETPSGNEPLNSESQSEIPGDSSGMGM